MKPWIKKTLAGVLGAFVVIGGLTACSGSHHHRGPMSAEKIAEVRGKVVDRISTHLDLNDAQQVKLRELADQVEAQRRALAGAATDPRAELQALVAGATFDRARAQSLLDDKTRAVQTHSPDVIRAMADFYDSLSAEQQQKVRERLERRKGWLSRG